jgi:hypothetical protein
MRYILLIIILIFFIYPLDGQEPDRIINIHLQNASFQEFSEIVFKQTGVRLFYDEMLFDSLKITIDADSVPVGAALREILKGTMLKPSFWHNDIVILKGEELIKNLPVWEQAAQSIDTAENKKGRTLSEERYLIGHKQAVIQTIKVGKQGVANKSNKVRIMGRIIDLESGEPLVSAPLYITETKTGAVTDINGFVMLAIVPGKYNAQIVYMGYSSVKFILEVYSEGSFTLGLKKAAIQLQDVVVSGESQSGILLKDPGMDQITIRNIRSLPVMMGESDILKVSGTLPGIISSEGGAGLNVRGSGSDQNAFYFNMIPVYNTSHLFGFFSAFNSDIIKDFSIYKGYIPLQYGGRLASVFNITTRQGNRKHITAHGGLSPVAGNVVIEGPIKEDTASFILSMRSSYSDWILSRLKDTTINSSSADFNDISGGVNWDFRDLRVSITGYHSYDHFRLSDINDYNYSNNGASLIIGKTFTSSLRGELAFVGSQYDFTATDRLEISSAWKHSYRLLHYTTRLGFKHVLNEANTIEYGADLNLFKLDRGIVQPYGEKSLREELDLGKENGYEGSVFISDLFKITPWLSIDPGIRYTLFLPVGPSEVYIYTSGSPLDIRYINDTLTFANKKHVKWYHEPEFRVSLNIKTDEDGSVKMIFNQMHQNLFMLNTARAIAPNTQWKLADYHLRPSESRQVSLGIYRTIPKNALETSIELYYKKAYNNPEFRDGADFLKNRLVETSVLQGDQNSYGFELYIKRSKRKLEGWISYAWSGSIIKIDGEYSWDRINNGKAYPSDFNIPHSLNAVFNYYITRRIILSSVLTYQTGRPVTYPESVYYINGSPYLSYSERNAYRIPDYMRLDLSMTLEGNLKAKKLIHSSLILNLYNATARVNPYSVFFNTVEGRIRSYKYTVIGVPVFTATWQFKFGNYASD